MLMQFGDKEHNLVPSNSWVTAFVSDVWAFMDYVFHYCDPKTCPVGESTTLVSFDPDAVDFCTDNLDRMMICEGEPTEFEFLAWELYKDEHKPSEWERIQQQLNHDLFEQFEKEFEDE